MSISDNKISYIGADLGGTKLLVGEIDGEGNILRSASTPSGRLDQESACRLIEDSLTDFLAEKTDGYAPAAVGIGLIGHIDAKNGEWMEIDAERKAPIPLAGRISRRSSLPCFIDNDVKSAAKAEMLFGYGRESQDFVYINVGTGIAAGTVSGGRLISGGHSNAGEVGHTCSGLDIRIPCPCGRDDCVESVASGMGIDKCARLLSSRYQGTRLSIPENGRVSAKEVFALYDSDPLCRVITDNAAKGLANLIMNMVRFSDPEIVVLGGGLVSDGFLLSLTEKYLSRHTIRYVTGGVRLTRLDPRFIGLIGAAANAALGMRTRTGTRS